jgi:hypothetical protein
MLKLILVVLACLAGNSFAADGEAQAPAPAAAAVAAASAPDTAQMERDLQRLDWKQFRSVVEAIPKLRADVERYGPAGWEIVRANYRIYHWKKNIDRLDATQKQELAGLIAQAKR